MRTHFLCISGATSSPEESILPLLTHQIGSSHRSNQPVTVRSALEAAGRDPMSTARRLMTLPPENAANELAAMIGGVRIDGVPCPDPMRYARQALARAGAEFVSHPFASDYGHSATAILGILALVAVFAAPLL